MTGVLPVPSLDTAPTMLYGFQLNLSADRFVWVATTNEKGDVLVILNDRGHESKIWIENDMMNGLVEAWKQTMRKFESEKAKELSR